MLPKLILSFFVTSTLVFMHGGLTQYVLYAVLYATCFINTPLLPIFFLIILSFAIYILGGQECFFLGDFSIPNLYSYGPGVLFLLVILPFLVYTHGG